MDMVSSKPVVGIVIAVICIILSLIEIKSIRAGNDKRAQIISALLAGIAILIDCIGVIVPGVKEYRGNVSGNGNYTITADSNSIAGAFGGTSQTINISGNNNVINWDGTPTGQNMENTDTDPVPPAVFSDAYDVVDEFPVGWWDSMGGRPSFTLEEINSGIVTPSVVFNSIADSKIGHEFNFVGSRENTGEAESEQSIWHADTLEAEDGKTYLVRLYAHNNNPRGYDGVAENVCVRFNILPTVFVRHNDVTLDGFNSADGYYGAAVLGILTSSNASPTEYGDGVKFVSNRPFHLEYIPGTARLNNAAPNNEAGFVLSDDILSTGVFIGYEELNGEIPGCYQFDSVTTIIVKPIFDD